MGFAIIETGGKQYKVTRGAKVRVEKLAGEAGSEIVFDKVLLTSGDTVLVGVPLVKGASVHGKILRQFRDDKKIVFRYHSKTRYRKKKGHRQHYTEVEITKI